MGNCCVPLHHNNNNQAPPRELLENSVRSTPRGSNGSASARNNHHANASSSQPSGPQPVAMRKGGGANRSSGKHSRNGNNAANSGKSPPSGRGPDDDSQNDTPAATAAAVASAVAASLNNTPKGSFDSLSSRLDGVARDMVVTHAEIGRDEDGNTTVNQYVIIKKLGVGSYGKVKLCINIDDNQLYALKICHKNMLRKKRMGTHTALDDVLREISILSRLSHRNIVRLYSVIDDPEEDRLFLVLEYMEGGPVMKRNLDDTGPLPLTTARSYFRDIVEGLDYLHSQRIIHRDLKPENLLVSADGTCKISDFGVAHRFEGDDDTLTSTAGSPAFLAPELCSAMTPRTTIRGRPVDMWALGVTLYCFMFGRVPWIADTVLDMYERIRAEEVPFPHSLGASLDDLLRRLLCKDPARRITMTELRQHPWLQEHDVS